MSRPWMPFYVADYLKDTRRLTTAQHGAYLLLIMEYWVAGGLPDDDSQLSRISGMTPLDWRKAKPVIQSFFVDGWRHERIEEELAKADVKHKIRSEAGKRGGIATANIKQNSSNAGGNAQASSSQPQSPKKKQDGATAPPEPVLLPLSPVKPQSPDPERDYFRRVREVVGQKDGGPIGAKLLKAKSGKISLARAAVEHASEKEKPVEYLFAIINKTDEAASQRGMDPRL